MVKCEIIQWNNWLLINRRLFIRIRSRSLSGWTTLTLGSNLSFTMLHSNHGGLSVCDFARRWFHRNLLAPTRIKLRVRMRVQIFAHSFTSLWGVESVQYKVQIHQSYYRAYVIGLWTFFVTSSAIQYSENLEIEMIRNTPFTPHHRRPFFSLNSLHAPHPTSPRISVKVPYRTLFRTTFMTIRYKVWNVHANNS